MAFKAQLSLENEFLSRKIKTLKFNFGGLLCKFPNIFFFRLLLNFCMAIIPYASHHELSRHQTLLSSFERPANMAISTTFCACGLFKGNMREFDNFQNSK